MVVQRNTHSENLNVPFEKTEPKDTYGMNETKVYESYEPTTARVKVFAGLAARLTAMELYDVRNMEMLRSNPPAAMSCRVRLFWL